ncbi:MAG TPA: ThiF family adenylyltransferase [Desulfatiglandales bacterium]|nr:ThiF family adenylyltransferase [Desulfatiglandales bacterium]
MSQHKIALKQSMRMHITSPTSIVIGSTPRTSIELANLSELHLRVLELLDGTRNLETIIIDLANEGFVHKEEEIEGFIQELSKHNLLEVRKDKDFDVLDIRSIERYSRQLSYFLLFTEERNHAFRFQKKLMESRVAILGIGGVGSYLAYGLVAIGVGSILGIDGDYVELSNVSRQILYNEKDIGRSKVDVAAEKLKLINSRTNLKFIPRNLCSPKEIHKVLQDESIDFLVLSADIPRGLIGQWVNEACVHASVSFCEVGSCEDIGIVGPIVIPGKTPCWLCGTSIPETAMLEKEYVRKLNQRFIPSIFDPLNAGVASIALIEITKHLTSFSECRLYGQRLFIDFTSLETYFETFTKNVACPVCGKLSN